MPTLHCGAIAFANVEAIIFDKDGTLANSQAFLKELAYQRSRLVEAQAPGVQSALLSAFGVVGDHLSPTGLMAVGTRQENEIAAAAYIAQTGRDWIEASTIAQTSFAEADRSLSRKAAHTPLFEGVLSLLQSLKAQGFKVGILSSDSEENVRDFVQYYHLNPYVQVQIGSREGLSKPDPRLLQLACEALEASVSNTIVVGDSQADIKLAKRGGAIGCVGVTWGGTSPDRLSGADVIVDHFEQIRAYARPHE